MNETLVFLGGDARMAAARQVLTQAGCRLAPEICPEMTHLVLPLPAFDSQGRVTGGPPLLEVLPKLPGGCRILGGKLGATAEELNAAGFSVRDYFLEEELTAQNAAITAEGAIQLAMDALPVTLRGTQALVIGWGRIGKLLTKALTALGCRVTATARKEKDLAMIRALGFAGDETGKYRSGLSQSRVIFHTVPAFVLSREQVAQTRPDCLLVELSTGGVMEHDGLRTHIAAGGLPGKTAPESAGRAIGQTILRLLSE